VMGALKSYWRWRVVASFISEPGVSSMMSTVAHVTLWPLASALYSYNAMAAAMSRRITWRGITYELKSANETVIIERQRSDVTDQMSEE
jgi:hypothetical protein